MTRRTWLAGVALVVCAVAVWAVLVWRVAPRPAHRLIDFTQYYDAASAVALGESPYRPEARRHSPAAFLMPPVFAQALRPLAWFSVDVANRIWFALTLVCLLVVCAAILSLGHQWRKWLDSELFTGAALLLTAGLFYPIWIVFRLGQVTLLLLALVLGGLWMNARGRPVLGGALVGLATAFKFLPLPLVVLTAFLGWKRFTTSAILVAIALHLGVLLLSPSLTREYWTDVVPAIGAIAGGVNLSPVGMARRASPEWRAAATALAYVGSVGMLLTAIGLTRKRGCDPWWLLALMLATTVTAAPMVENHYLAWLLPAVWLLLGWAVAAGSAWRLVGFAAVFTLLSQPFRLSRQLERVGLVPWPPEVLGEGLQTIGALLVWAMTVTAIAGGAAHRVQPGSEA
jgi:hypothetical protein